MKILQNTKLRIFVLVFALVSLGGATTGMFFASSQNKAVLASETDDDNTVAVAKSCAAGQRWNNEYNRCVPICNADQQLNTSTFNCEDIKKDIPVTAVKFSSDTHDISATIKREELNSYTVNVPAYTYEPNEATNPEFTWKSSNENVVEIDESTGSSIFKPKGFGETTLTLYYAENPSISASFVIELIQDTSCPSGQVWQSNIDNNIDYGNCVNVEVQCGENETKNENGVCICNDGYEKLDNTCVKKTILVSSVTVTPESASGVFELGEKISLDDFLEKINASVSFNPIDADDIGEFTWSSKNEDIIGVTYEETKPMVTVNEYGTATLIIGHDNVQDSIDVTIVKNEIALEKINLNADDINVTVKESNLKITDISDKISLPSPVYSPENATNIGDVWWESADGNIVKIAYYESIDEALSAENCNTYYSSNRTLMACKPADISTGPLFIPVSYGETKIYLTNGIIKSNEITIKIDQEIENDLDGDGIPDDSDDDIDGDGYLNDDDDTPLSYTVGDRDLLMFATLAYDPVDSVIDRIAGDTKTQNGNTVAQNFYAKYGEDAVVESDSNGYSRYFSYICPNRVSNKQAEKNDCMYNEDELIGMQAQDYSGLDGIIKAWQTVGKDYYFGGSDEVSISEVNQWVITDHESQKVTISDKEGYLEATTFRLNNNIVIAYRGTDFTDLMEWLKDITFVSGGISGYEAAAKAYAEKIFGHYANEYYTDPDAYIEKYGGAPNFYITGHSLGGYLTQIATLGMIESNSTGAEFLRDVIYFNGMGLGFFGGQRLEDYNKLFSWATQTNEAGSLLHRVICYHINGDPVSALGRHINKIGYYASEDAILRHATQNVSKLQSLTRNKLADGIVDVFMNAVGKIGEFGVLNTSTLDDVKEYLNYYSALYGANFEGKFSDSGTISILDLMWFCHEPSASLFYNIRKGVNGHSEVDAAKTKMTSLDYLLTDEETSKDWYGESVNVTNYIDNDKRILTAQVTGDAKDYTWYKDDEQEIGTGNTIALNPNDSGLYYVKATVKSRKGTKNNEIVLSTEDNKIDVKDLTAPQVTISAVNDVWTAKTDSSITLKVIAKSASGFSKSSISASDISKSSLIANKITIDTPERVESECTDQTEVWTVKITSTLDGAFTIMLNDGAFVSKNNVRSEAIKSQVAMFTVLSKESDKRGPTVTIEALDGLETEKGGTLRFLITAYDEGGIKEDNFEDNISTEPTLAKFPYVIDSVEKSDDEKTISYVVSVNYTDDTKITAAGQILVKSKAFIDNSGNVSDAEASSTFKFVTPADKIAPTIAISPSSSNKTEYGGSLTYDIIVSDDSGLDTDAILTTDNVRSTAANPWIDISSISGPSYNDNKTIANYKVTITSNDKCSRVLGCSGTFYIASSSIKDIYGNDNVFIRLSPLITFSSEVDHIAPLVTISADSSRSATVGETIKFSVVATDNSGINQDSALTKDDFKLSNDDAVIESVSDPVFSNNGRKATYVVTVRGINVTSAVYLSLPSGKIKDNNDNSNILSKGDFMIFTKPADIQAPKVSFEAIDGWSTEVNDSIVINVKISDNNQLKGNKSLTKDDFYITNVYATGATIDVSSPSYAADKSYVTYKVTLKSSNSGSGYLWLKYGKVQDTSNNNNLLSQSQKFTFKKATTSDTKAPTVTISAINGWRTKAGNDLKIKVTVKDDYGLDNPVLTKDLLKTSGNKDITIVSVASDKTGEKEASWIVTLNCSKSSFNFITAIKDANIKIPGGLFKDTSGNKNVGTSQIVSFTKR